MIRGIWNKIFADPKKSLDIKSEFITRSEWGAKPPVYVDKITELPVPTAVITDTRTRSCSTKDECIFILKELQTMDMRVAKPDIENNFYIGGDGNIYQGRGWTTKRAKLFKDDPTLESSISIAYIGTWLKDEGEKPPEDMNRLALRLITLGVNLNHLSPKCLSEN